MIDRLVVWVARKAWLAYLVARRRRDIASGRLSMGSGSYGFPRVDYYDPDIPQGRVIIGKNCAIARGVVFVCGGNHYKAVGGESYSKGNITIGDNVWIGTEATIMSGVTVGEGAFIGAKSVVAKDVPAMAVVVGNPARVIKIRDQSSQ